MKKVIGGKLYNTETSTLIKEYWNGYGRGDFKFCCEALYKTSKGIYFLHGEGGAMSKYVTHFGNYLDSGEVIVELTRMEAMEWLSENGFDESIEQEFSDLIEEA